jgi:hypothetical protein
VAARARETARARVTDTYTAECARLSGEAVARFTGGGYIGISLWDLMHPRPTKSAEDTLSDLVSAGAFDLT